MLPVCTSTLKPYVIGSNNAISVYADSAADSSGSACQKFAAGSSNTVQTVNAESCKIAANANAYPVIKQCEPLAVSPFSMSVSDGVTLSGLILSVWVSALVFRWFIAVLRGKGEESA